MPTLDQFITEEAFREALRDWFAGQAVAGLLQAYGKDVGTLDELAADAYEAADAMLVRRISEGAP